MTTNCKHEVRPEPVDKPCRHRWALAGTHPCPYCLADERCQLREDLRKAEKVVTDSARIIRDLTEALIWCGGSNDFAPGGQARRGWEKIVQPLLERTTKRKETT